MYGNICAKPVFGKINFIFWHNLKNLITVDTEIFIPEFHEHD